MKGKRLWRQLALFGFASLLVWSAFQLGSMKIGERDDSWHILIDGKPEPSATIYRTPCGARLLFFRDDMYYCDPRAFHTPEKTLIEPISIIRSFDLLGTLYGNVLGTINWWKAETDPNVKIEKRGMSFTTSRGRRITVLYE